MFWKRKLFVWDSLKSSCKIPSALWFRTVWWGISIYTMLLWAKKQKYFFPIKWEKKVEVWALYTFIALQLSPTGPTKLSETFNIIHCSSFIWMLRSYFFSISWSIRKNKIKNNKDYILSSYTAHKVSCTHSANI